MHVLLTPKEITATIESAEYTEFLDTVVCKSDVDAFRDFILRENGDYEQSLEFNAQQTHAIKFHGVDKSAVKPYLDADYLSSNWFFNKLLKNFPLPLFLTEDYINPSFMIASTELKAYSFETRLTATTNKDKKEVTVILNWVLGNVEFILLSLTIDGEEATLDDMMDCTLTVSDSTGLNLKTGTVEHPNLVNRLEVFPDTPKAVDDIFKTKDFKRHLKTFKAKDRDVSAIRRRYLVEHCKFKDSLSPAVKHAIKFITDSLPDLELGSNKQLISKLLKRKLFNHISLDTNLVPINPVLEYKKWLSYPILYSDNFAPIRLNTLQLKRTSKNDLELKQTDEGNCIEIYDAGKLIYLIKGFREQTEPFITKAIEATLIDTSTRDGYECEFTGNRSSDVWRIASYEMTYCIYAGEIEITSLKENRQQVDINALDRGAIHFKMPVLLTKGPINIIEDFPKLATEELTLCFKVNIELS